MSWLSLCRFGFQETVCRWMDGWDSAIHKTPASASYTERRHDHQAGDQHQLQGAGFRDAEGIAVAIDAGGETRSERTVKASNGIKNNAHRCSEVGHLAAAGNQKQKLEQPIRRAVGIAKFGHLTREQR